jgi:acetyl esterase/lipase
MNHGSIGSGQEDGGRVARTPVRRSTRLFASLVAVVLIVAPAGCGSVVVTPSPTVTTTPPPTPSATESPAPATEPPPTVQEFSDLLYQEDPDGRRHVTSVYAPVGDGGPWPVAVMLHGGGGYPLLPDASTIAALGAVVFAPRWSDHSPWQDAAAFRADMTGGLGTLACVVRFARAEAARYGGDPSRLSLYGHSAGANNAAMIAFAGPEASAGCVAEAGSIVPDNLVLFEGDWLLQGAPVWSDLLREDPSVIDLATPWSDLASAARMPVHVIDSVDPTLSAPFDAEALALRDQTGEFRDELEDAGALEDGILSETDIDRLFTARLESLGYEASLHELVGSLHTFISTADRPVFEDAILGR